MADELSKEIRVEIKGKNVYKALELKGRLEADNNEEMINNMIDELYERIYDEGGNEE